MNAGTWQSVNLMRERQRKRWRFLCRLFMLLPDVRPDSFLCSLPNTGLFFLFMSVYHILLIIRIIFQFTNGTQKSRKSDLLRITEQKFRESKEIIYILVKGLPY